MSARELVILSGKGGTGKTSVTGAFARLAKNVVMADCDVDSADLYLLLPPLETEEEDFYSGVEPVVGDDCAGCGRCADVCRFAAVGLVNGRAEVDLLKCEGCGVCADQCPVEAIVLRERLTGKLFVSRTDVGAMVHARLGVGGENSGKLVTAVREKARTAAENRKAEMILVDGPPGIGCAVIASVTGASAALVVAEPSMSSLHDLRRALDLCRRFEIPTFVCCNKYDVNLDVWRQVREAARQGGAEYLGEIRYDPSVTKAMIEARPVADLADSPAAIDIRKLWGNLSNEWTM